MPPTAVPSFTVAVGNDVRTCLGKSACGARRRSETRAARGGAGLCNEFGVCNQCAANVSG
eukprot:2976813-Prorocentrum_lima.AAC.1